MTRMEAIRHLVGGSISQTKLDALVTLGVTDDELDATQHALWMEREIERLERRSPFWRGEDMGT